MKTEEQAVLRANDAFYTAFSNSDFESMEQLWSTQHHIAVIHPGWPPLLGRQSVISSWKQIMKGGLSSTISCTNTKVNMLGEVALVICNELLAEAELIATNGFILEQGDWKMIHHQAGPLPLSNNIAEGDTLH